jgi:hypothetical protein
MKSIQNLTPRGGGGYKISVHPSQSQVFPIGNDKIGYHIHKMKFLASTIALTSTLAGMASATVQGFDISSYQGTVDFAAAYRSGARFVIIKVRRKEMTPTLQGSQARHLITRKHNHRRQPREPTSSTAASRRTTTAPRRPASSEAAITSRTRIRAAARRRRTTFLRTAAAGPTTASRCPACWTSSTIRRARPATG